MHVIRMNNSAIFISDSFKSLQKTLWLEIFGFTLQLTYLLYVIIEFCDDYSSIYR